MLLLLSAQHTHTTQYSVVRSHRSTVSVCLHVWAFSSTVMEVYVDIDTQHTVQCVVELKLNGPHNEFLSAFFIPTKPVWIVLSSNVVSWILCRDRVCVFMCLYSIAVSWVVVVAKKKQNKSIPQRFNGIGIFFSKKKKINFFVARIFYFLNLWNVEFISNLVHDGMKSKFPFCAEFYFSLTADERMNSSNQ